MEVLGEGAPSLFQEITRNWCCSPGTGKGLSFGMAWDQETIQNVGRFPRHRASIALAPLGRTEPAGNVPPGEAARFGADEELPRESGVRMMQWAAALAPPRSPGSRLGPGHGQGKWPQQALGGLGAKRNTGTALHRAPGARGIGFFGRSLVFHYPLSHGVYRWSTKSQCKVNLAASAHGKKPQHFVFFPRALVTHPQIRTTSHLLLSLFTGKATEGGWGGTVGLEARGWSSSDDPQLQSSAVHLQGQELQSVVAAVTPVMFDLS